MQQENLAFYADVLKLSQHIFLYDGTGTSMPGYLGAQLLARVMKIFR